MHLSLAYTVEAQTAEEAKSFVQESCDREPSLVPRPTSQLRMDYSGDVIHPQLRCGSGYETTESP